MRDPARGAADAAAAQLERAHDAQGLGEADAGVLGDRGGAEASEAFEAAGALEQRFHTSWRFGFTSDHRTCTCVLGL